MFKTKLIVTAFFMAVLAFAYTGYSAWDAKTDLELSRAKVEKLEAKLSERQLEVDILDASVRRADDFLSQLKRERSLLDSLHQQQLADRAKYQAELVAAIAAVNNLRQSHDQFVKAWADAHMPGAAVRLYHYAEYTGNYPDGGTAGSGVSDSAGKFNGRLLASTTF